MRGLVFDLIDAEADSSRRGNYLYIIPCLGTNQGSTDGTGIRDSSRSSVYLVLADESVLNSSIAYKIGDGKGATEVSTTVGGTASGRDDSVGDVVLKITDSGFDVRLLVPGSI